jgi:hypothetical protein
MANAAAAKFEKKRGEKKVNPRCLHAEDKLANGVKGLASGPGEEAFMARDLKN